MTKSISASSDAPLEALYLHSSGLLVWSKVGRVVMEAR
jgi:hypothetical protein